MIKKLKSLKQILSENNYDIDYNDIILYYVGNEVMRIDCLMKDFFGSEIEVKVYEDRWQGLNWFWKDDWFVPEVELLEDSLFEI